MKNYREWISENERDDHRDLLSQEQLEWCENHMGEDEEWWVNDDGEVQVEKNLTFRSKEDIEEFPVQFADVEGNFYCHDSWNLTSLKGAPKKVGGSFYCINCENLTSLEGAPRKVGGRFDCEGCKSLTSLEGAPEEVGGDFDCYGCEALTSLEGAPKKVGGMFRCSYSEVTSLEGAPEEVGGGFDCDNCASLTSLEGLPKKFRKLSADNCSSLSQVEQEFAADEELQEKWKKSPLGWQEFMYTGGSAMGRKYGL